MRESATRKLVKLKKKPGTPGWYREDQKINAVAEYLILGSIPEVSRKTGIALQTLRNWKQSDFWKQTAEELQKESNQKLQGKLSGVIDKGLEVIDDRLTNGDSVYNSKTGKIVKMPLKAKDANQITKDAIDKRIMLEKVNKVEKQTDQGINERLDNLKKEFLKFVNSKEIKASEMTNDKEVVTTSFRTIEELVPETEGPTQEQAVKKATYTLKAEGGIFGVEGHGIGIVGGSDNTPVK